MDFINAVIAKDPVLVFCLFFSLVPLTLVMVCHLKGKKTPGMIDYMLYVLIVVILVRGLLGGNLSL